MIKKILYTFCFILLSTYTFSQCSLCRVVTETGRNDNGTLMAQGINDGILYLIAVSYLIFFTVAFIIYRQYKKDNKFLNS